MRQHHLQVRRTARYAVLGGPENYRGPAAAGEPGSPGGVPVLSNLWIVCHGYRQLAARFLAAFSPIAGPERMVVAPEALSRFYIDDDGGAHGPDAKVGATWMTREDRLAEIDDYVNYLDRLHARILDDIPRQHPPPRVRVLGFSQGTATVCRWLAFGSASIEHLVLWAGAPAFDLDLHDPGIRARFQGVALTLVAGTDDPLYSPSAVERARERLTEAGLSHRLLTFPGGHRIDRGVILQLAEGGEAEE